MSFQGRKSRLARLLGRRRWCVGLMGMVILLIPGLVSASTGSASSTSTEPTAVTVDWSGTFSSSYEEPNEGGVMTQAINLTWTATGAFNYQGQPTQPATLQVNGTMTETDNSPAAPTLQDNCTAQLTALPSAYYVNNGLMDATVGQDPPDTGEVNARADVVAQYTTPSDFIQTNGTAGLRDLPHGCGSGSEGQQLPDSVAGESRLGDRVIQREATAVVQRQLRPILR